MVTNLSVLTGFDVKRDAKKEKTRIHNITFHLWHSNSFSLHVF